MVLFPRGHGRGYRVAAASHTPVLLCGLGRSIQVLMIMEPKHSAEMSKHLEKQNQALMGTYRAMSHELHKLQVQEEAIMHKLYELMSAEGLLPKHKKEKHLERDVKESNVAGKQRTEP
ncbi:uncharacterized protein [Miscanthus floridulus]|uniref:uncharacterized protein isoform X1 n=1 Tax=Miscanthus floridulus TaxID=154761 RepID=UPI00345B49A5